MPKIGLLLAASWLLAWYYTKVDFSYFVVLFNTPEPNYFIHLLQMGYKQLLQFIRKNLTTQTGFCIRYQPKWIGFGCATFTHRADWPNRLIFWHEWGCLSASRIAWCFSMTAGFELVSLTLTSSLVLPCLLLGLEQGGGLSIFSHCVNRYLSWAGWMGRASKDYYCGPLIWAQVYLDSIWTELCFL